MKCLCLLPCRNVSVNLIATACRLTSLLSSRPACRMGQGEQIPGTRSHERLIYFLFCGGANYLWVLSVERGVCVSPFSRLEY